MILLIGTALAGSCCTSVGAQPTLLASCDALAVAVGVGGDVEYGGWSWSGAWSPVGDDGGGSAALSATIMGRIAPWMQAGLRIPVALAIDSLDGETSAALGMGAGIVWIGVETPAGWPSADGPRAGFEVGFGSAGSSSSAGAKVVQGVARVSAGSRWAVEGSVAGRAPIIGIGVPEAEASVRADRAIGGRARVGIGAGLLAAGGIAPQYALSVGPSLVLAPSHTDRLLLTTGAGIPLAGFGQNAPSRLVLSLDWYRALAPTG